MKKEKLTFEQLDALSWTKAMLDFLKREDIGDEWQSVDDVLTCLLENGEMEDEEKYLRGLMELTQLGFVVSSITDEEALDLSDLNGVEITEVTEKGLSYLKNVQKEAKKTEWRERLGEFIVIMEDNSRRINESETLKLLERIRQLILP